MTNVEDFASEGLVRDSCTHCSKRREWRFLNL